MANKKDQELLAEKLNEDLTEIAETIEVIEEKPAKYTLSMKPSIRKHLTDLAKYYGKTTDSALLQEIIEQLYEKMKIDLDVDYKGEDF